MYKACIILLVAPQFPLIMWAHAQSVRGRCAKMCKRYMHTYSTTVLGNVCYMLNKDGSCFLFPVRLCQCAPQSSSNCMLVHITNYASTKTYQNVLTVLTDVHKFRCTFGIRFLPCLHTLHYSLQIHPPIIYFPWWKVHLIESSIRKIQYNCLHQWNNKVHIRNKIWWGLWYMHWWDVEGYNPFRSSHLHSSDPIIIGLKIKN